MAQFTKSRGHICFGKRHPQGVWEYVDQEGQVYRCALENVLDGTGNRAGRWECSRNMFDLNRSMIVGEEVTEKSEKARQRRNAMGRARYQVYKDLGLYRNRNESWE